MEEPKIKKEKCAHTNPDGVRCNVYPLHGESMCLFHSDSERANKLRRQPYEPRQFKFGNMKVRNQAEVLQFVQAFLQEIGTIGVSITPQMTKATSDLVNSYLGLKQLELEQSAISKSLEPEPKEEGE